MILELLSIEGFRCFKDRSDIPIHDLTILIGENDSGKSTVLYALELLLSRKEALPEDFFQLDGAGTDHFTIGATFRVSPANVTPEVQPFLHADCFTVRKTYVKDIAFKTEVLIDAFTDQDLAHFETFNAEQLKQLLQRLGLAAQANQEARKVSVRDHIRANQATLAKETKYVAFPFTQISGLLPIYQGYASHEYGDPQQLIRKTLDTIYRNHFYDEAGNLRVKRLQSLQQTIKSNLNDQLKNNLLVHVKRYSPKVRSIQGKFEIDFSRGLDFQGIELDEGLGYKLVDQKGEGSKKRLFLSILEWDKEVQLEQENRRNIIRGYDEPDANLHYDAQRRMFYAINEVTQSPSSNLQAIIATHSISMIDRAPAKSIVHILQDNGQSKEEHLLSDGDEDIKTFLDQISEIGGISNSSIFYEKCFLLVEGDSEDIALKKLYRRCFDRSLAEDGIVLVNLQSNGAWYNFLKLLNRNKRSCTFMLLDSDTQNADCGANVTVPRLIEIGFDADFLRDNVFFAGTQEFEDIFPDARIRDSLNTLYPRDTKGKWSLSHVRALRAKFPKISKGLYDITLPFTPYNKKRYKKPEFASMIVDLLSKKDVENLAVMNSLFKAIHGVIKD